MGPIALFDKSFLQSLNPDEAVWFDLLFDTNVCPMFTMECMADLGLSKLKGERTPEHELSGIAQKFPVTNGRPNETHVNLFMRELLGRKVPMERKIIPPPQKLGCFKSPEVETFIRWKKGKFRDIEKFYAGQWRNALANFDLGKLKKTLNSFGIDRTQCKSFDDARKMADDITTSSDDLENKMGYLLSPTGLNIPKNFQLRIREYWEKKGFLPLAQFAPYASFVLKIQSFYYFSLASSLPHMVSPKSLIDTMYLFYLPFCMVFISSDRIHHSCAPLFLREDQELIYGNELKKDLAKINQYYLQLPHEVKEKGRMTFASTPPKDGEFLIGQLWDRYIPNWRAE